MPQSTQRESVETIGEHPDAFRADVHDGSRLEGRP